jgi:hypothetical protein
LNAQDFVEAIKVQVSDAAVVGLTSQLEKPAGRRPAAKLLRLSEWYRSLSEANQEFVREIVRESAESATFGFFCILDGVRAIESRPAKGSLELIYRTADQPILLNDPNALDHLHDLYKQSLADSEATKC